MAYRLEDFGSFHVGGRMLDVTGLPKAMVQYTPASPPTEKDPNGRYIIEQAYVQYFIPEGAEGRTPLVLLHGGGLTGVTWESTPDGRPGWLHHFLSFGYPVYVVDQPERGRSGFSVIEGEWDGKPVSRPDHEAWTLFRFGDLEGYRTRTPYPDCDFPTEHLDDFMRQFVPRWTTTREIHVRTFREIVERIGPCHIVAHSQGGDASHMAAAARPDLVRSLVAVEPSGFAPALDTTRLDGQRYLYVMGDYFDRDPYWQLFADKTRDSITRLQAAGAKAELLWLAEAGCPGATHMAMMDRANARSARLVHDWLRGSA